MNKLARKNLELSVISTTTTSAYCCQHLLYSHSLHDKHDQIIWECISNEKLFWSYQSHGLTTKTYLLENNFNVIYKILVKPWLSTKIQRHNDNNI